ncbi:S-adenosyl-L-methionine-dependent methyltransferase [Xylariaceae sp. FL0255]|nr:S-adenosyl-L-methionine-dependent methyltransferase [Xylariaceae sp. FL0255]
MTSQSSDGDLAALISKIEAFSSDSAKLDSLDGLTRYKLSEAARKLSLATESINDSTHRILHSPMQLPLAVVGVETHLFEILAEQKTATTADLAKSAKIDRGLLDRLLRYYQSVGMVDQLSKNQYRANNVTSALAAQGCRDGLPFSMGVLVPFFNAIPQYLRDSQYANFSNGAYTPWHLGHNTNMHTFDWMKERPQLLNHFLGWMACQRVGLPMFLDVYDFQKEFASGATKETPVFVDIGGNVGHQCIAVRQRLPNLVGRIILQDREEVIEQVQKNPLPGFEGIEAVAYDFFKPQPIKGARAYYMRNVLHDWPEHKCVEILNNIKPAMTSDSRILIDEMVVPEVAAPWRSTQLDLTMGSAYAAAERTLPEWEALVEKAGLKIPEVRKCADQDSHSIIVTIPK